MGATDNAGMQLSRMWPGGRGGFTILELMIVVTLIGVIASIAIPLFVQYQLKSRSAEGKINLAAIRTCEEAYFAEYKSYVTAVPEPPVLPGNARSPFDSMTTNFAQLGFAPEGSVYFSYGVAVSADGAGYTADAAADIDGDGLVQFWGYAKPDNGGALTGGQVGCNVAGLTPVTVGPCDPASGRWVF